MTKKPGRSGMAGKLAGGSKRSMPPTKGQSRPGGKIKGGRGSGQKKRP